MLAVAIAPASVIPAQARLRPATIWLAIGTNGRQHIVFMSRPRQGSVGPGERGSVQASQFFSELDLRDRPVRQEMRATKLEGLGFEELWSESPPVHGN